MISLNENENPFSFPSISNVTPTMFATSLGLTSIAQTAASTASENKPSTGVPDKDKNEILVCGFLAGSPGIPEQEWQISFLKFPEMAKKNVIFLTRNFFNLN